ncbi:MAG: alpha/beta hydrolase [Polyangiaceae bacterium]
MNLLLTAVGAYSAVCLLAYLGQRKLLFPAPTRGEVPVMDGAKLTKVTTPQGRVVHALHVPAVGSAPTVVHFHGNGEELADLVPLAWSFRRSGLGFFAVEYPGYGLSKAYAPSEADLYSDAEAALWHLHNGLSIPTEQVVLQGQSLGSGVATEMAKRGHGMRLVLISPFTSVPDVAREKLPILPAKLLLKDRFDNAAKAAGIALPVLIVHGTEDEVIPVQMGEALSKIFPNASLFLAEGAHHNDLFVQDGRRVLERIAAFAKGEYVEE